jgi:hypothetical protein
VTVVVRRARADRRHGTRDNADRQAGERRLFRTDTPFPRAAGRRHEFIVRQQNSRTIPTVPQGDQAGIVIDDNARRSEG